jgi:hypothetical protein
MIPIFPNFKKVSIEDKKDIEFYTHQYKPYSDFNFTSLWVWDTDDKRMISILNDNLVVLFTDYETCELCLSFLGKNKIKHTINELIEYAQKIGISTTLRYVPEEVIKDLNSMDLLIEEDVHNFDYIFSISDLSEFFGSKYKEKRHLAEKFLRSNPNISFEFIDINDLNMKSHIISLFDRWKNKKTHNFEYEERAIKRLLQTSKNEHLTVSCMFLNSEMVGFSVDEILPFKYAISHFFKTDNSYDGINEFFNKKISQYLIIHDIKYWNWEQDLGVENLKKSKMKYNPIDFLKKYKVTLIN